MFFTYLALYRCTRLSLSEHEKVEIYPSQKTQMILGTNGSGKSSLLRLGFSVLPSQKEDFHKGGYKIVKVPHNGHHYTLTSSYIGKGLEHSFVCDGEELNPGKTAAVQKELVREHFGITQDLHDLLTGNIVFTDLSLLERRDWIARLSSTDFNYVLGLYGKVKKGVRFAANIVKHNTERLSQETGKLLSQEDIAALEKRSREVKDELNVLFQELKDLNDVNTHALEEDLTRELKAIEDEFNTLLDKPIYPPEGFYWNSETHLLSDIQDADVEIKYLERSLTSLGEEFQNYEHQMEKLKQIEGYDEAFIRKRIRELEGEAQEHLSYITAGLAAQRVDRDRRASESLIEFMHHIADADARKAEKFTESIVKQKREELSALNERLSSTSMKIGNIEGRLQHIDNCEEVNCPQCNHVFKPGVGKDEQVKLAGHLDKGRDISKRLKEKIAEHTRFLAEAQSYLDRINLLYNFRKEHRDLTGFWSLVDAAGGLQKGYDLLPLCQLYLKDLEYAAKLDKVDTELRPLKEALATIERVGAESNGIRDRYYTLKGEIEETARKMHQAQERSSIINSYRKKLERFARQAEVLMARYEGFKQKMQEYVELIRQDELKAVIRKHQGTLAIVETALTESEIQHGIIKDIEKEIEKMTLEEQAYRLLEKMLSPVDGLIAEQISVFINAMIDKINAVIARIWGYNLAIKPCNLDENDLDYRFPLYAVKEENSIPDIRNGSESQKDIVNQAFRLVVYKFMRLHGYPLYLDELGRTFDEVHRTNLIPAIKDLIDDDTYSQVFIISHYIDSQASFQDSQVIVLHDRHLNAEFRRTYNEHVVFS